MIQDSNFGEKFNMNSTKCNWNLKSISKLNDQFMVKLFELITKVGI